LTDIIEYRITKFLNDDEELDYTELSEALERYRSGEISLEALSSEFDNDLSELQITSLISKSI